jgi:hypothetical protein
MSQRPATSYSTVPASAPAPSTTSSTPRRPATAAVYSTSTSSFQLEDIPSEWEYGFPL